MSHLLEGSLRKTGSRIRIAVKLIDTNSESQLWAEQYERDAPDLLTLQREVAEAITRQITTKLGVARSNVDPMPDGIRPSPRRTITICAGVITSGDERPSRDSRRPGNIFSEPLTWTHPTHTPSVAWPIPTRCSAAWVSCP